MFDTETHRYGKTSTVNHVPHAVENLSSTFNPQYCQIPGSKGEPNRSVGLEFGRNVTGARPTWQVYSQQGKNMGRGKWDLCIPGGYWGGWRRCCHPPVRFPLCILGLCPSCAPLTSLMGAKAIIDPCMCVCVCIPDFKSYCCRVFCTDFVINDATTNRTMVWKRLLSYCFTFHGILIREFIHLPVSLTRETVYNLRNQDGV